MDSEELDTRTSHIKFLMEKVEWIRDQIEENSYDIQDKMAETLLEEYSEEREYVHSQLSENVQEDIRTSDRVIAEEWDIKFSSFTHPAFFLLDSFFLDMKRLIEFQLKLVRDIYDENKEDDSFSIQTFLKHMRGETASPSDFAQYLRESDSDLMGFIESNMEWMNNFSSRRTYLAHYGIELGMEKEQFRFVYEEEVDMDNPDAVELPESVRIDGRDIVQRITEDIDKMKDFTETVEDTGSSILRVRRRIEELERSWIFPEVC